MIGSGCSAIPQVLVPIANGTEPMEAVITIDVLRRAGAHVAVASVEPGAATVAASWGVKLAADALLADLADDEFDLISLPVSQIFLLSLQWLQLLLCCVLRKMGLNWNQLCCVGTGHFVFFLCVESWDQLPSYSI